MQARSIRIVFDEKPISKQKGYTTAYRYSKQGRRYPGVVQTEDYKAFKLAAGLRAKAEAVKQGWGYPRTCHLAFFGYFFCPKGVRSQDLSDNAFSGYLDAFEGILYENDRQIVRNYNERIFTKKLIRVEMIFKPFE